MKKKILFTSIGSLVGKNFLESLHRRRTNIELVGTNSVVEAPNNYLCDTCYLVAQADDTEKFKDDLLKIIEKEAPEAIVAGRDDDVVILSELGEIHPKIKDLYIGGNAELAKITEHKLKSYVFATENDLPFAPTVESNQENGKEQLTALTNKFGFPVIAKPNKGNGSRGMWLVHNKEQLEKVNNIAGFSIQPFFKAHDEEPPILDTTLGTPFFWEIPEQSLYGSQIVISKKGKILGIVTYKALVVRGKCEKLEAYKNKDFTLIADKFARVMAQKGWRGPLNIQYKKDAKHGFNAIEMNGRFSGGTSARFYIGLDEVQITLNDWLGEGTIPKKELHDNYSAVERLPSDFPIRHSDETTLLNNHFWRKPAN